MDFDNDTDVFNQFADMNKEDFEEKLNQTKTVNANPLRMVIAPVSMHYSMDILNQLYDYYLKLSQENKNYSDQKSVEIWGRSVPDMYDLIKSHIETKEAMRKETIPIDIGAQVESADYIGLCESGIELSNMNYSNSELGLKESLMKDIDTGFDKDYSLAIKQSECPFYTLDEMFDLHEQYDFEDEVIEEHTYRYMIEKYQSAFAHDPTPENMLKCFSIGWNPYVSPSKQAFAKSKQLNWYRENGFRVVDLTKYIDEEVVTEASMQTSKLFVEKNMYPVYIVLSYTSTPFGKVIRKVRGSYYTHAGLSLDSNMNEIFTFKYDKDKIKKAWNCGFQIESLDYYRKVSKDAEVEILTLFVDKSTLNLIHERLNYFVEHQEESKYGFKNLINILLNRAKDNDPNALSMICTQFVDTVLKAANIDITKKPSNLVDPGTFMEVSENPKIYKFYEGRVDKYNPKKIDNAITKLFDSTIRSRILYKDKINLMDEVYMESIQVPVKTMSIYEEALDELLTPTLTIQERVFPLGIRDDGRFNINIFKSLQDQYQESHDLLMNYTKDNIEGIKHELAKLFYLNLVLEKKIYKMKMKDKDRKKTVDLRARVLNDFKKYFKVISEDDKEFNFGEYYSKSEFNKGNLVIDDKLVKAAGKSAMDYINKLK